MTADAPQITETPRRPRRRLRRVVATTALALVALLATAGCTPAEMRAWWDTQGVDHSQMSDAEVQPWADAATAYWAGIYAELVDLQKFAYVLNEQQLYNLRWCESGDNYELVSASGAYRGAYMFHQATWDTVARLHHPKYVGMDPAKASHQVQDAMVRALWSMEGPRPWPVCGYRV